MHTRVLCPLLVGLSATALSTASHTFAANPADVPLPSVAVERRGGFTLGVNLAPLGTGLVTGYPNKIDQIDNPRYRQRLKLPPASSWSVFVGSTPRDWLTLGLTFRTDIAASGALRYGGGMIGLRFEAFPAYAAGGFYRDLALTAEVGAGFAGIVDGDDEKVADGGSLASLSLGAYWDALRFWHMSVGPSVSYSFQTSETLTGSIATLGLRAAFYGTRLDD